MKLKHCLVSALSLSIVATVNLFGQANDETFQQFRFNFSTPGARASAMGRTFLGIAEDGSAAVSNPSGLVLLTRPQFYFEYKHTDLRTRRLALVDSFSTLEPSTFYADLDSFSFFNVTWPVKRFAFSYARHEFLNYEESFVLGPRRTPGDPNSIFFPFEGRTDINGISNAFSVAFSITDKLSVAGSVTVDRLSFSTFSRRFDDGTFFGLGEINLVGDQTDDSDTGVGFNLSALFRPSDRFTIGGIYSKGSEFRLQTDVTANPVIVDQNAPPEQVFGPLVPLASRSLVFKVPDRWGVGVSGRPTEWLLLGLDVLRIEYSDLISADNFLILDNVVFETFDEPLQGWNGQDYRIDNATEVHFGGEIDLAQLFRKPANKFNAFLRGGVFSDPDHSLRFVGTSGDPDIDLGESLVFNTFPSETHVGSTFGGGVIIKNHLLIDAAYVSVNNFDEFVLSVAFRIPGK